MIDVKALNDLLNSGIETSDDGTSVARLTESMRIESMERFARAPYRSRGAFVATSIAALVAYLEQRGSNDARVFIDSDTPMVTAILNFGSIGAPSWQDDTAVCSAIRSRAFKALLACAGTISQEAIVNYIDDWMPRLTFLRDGQVVPSSAARGLFADLTVESVRQARSDRSQNFQREQSVTEKMSMGVKTPDTLVLRAPVLDGAAPVDICCSLSVAEVGGVPALCVRVMAEQAMLEDAREDFCDAAAAGCDGLAVVHYGTYTAGA